MAALVIFFVALMADLGRISYTSMVILFVIIFFFQLIFGWEVKRGQ